MYSANIYYNNIKTVTRDKYPPPPHTQIPCQQPWMNRFTCDVMQCQQFKMLIWIFQYGILIKWLSVYIHKLKSKQWCLQFWNVQMCIVMIGQGVWNEDLNWIHLTQVCVLCLGCLSRSGKDLGLGKKTG